MRRLIIIFVTFLSLIACNEKGKRRQNVDPFYSNKGEFDLARFPLVKPYEAVATIPGNDWLIHSVDPTEVLGTIPGTKNINVIDSVIFTYSENTILDGQSTKEAWFVVIPKQHIFKGFENHNEYLNFLNSIKIKEPKMFPVKQIFQYFDDNDTLNWKRVNRLY